MALLRHAEGTTVLFRPSSRGELPAIEPTFDEEKCRNVLVRYCAHIPRNYQYRDGVRLVFLVLRDHLGDECLGLAGGVLYELIEVDCQHSDDPGAAFQRWRYDHLRRHADFELPHVPHLTTVATSIVPTTLLMKWRRDHTGRYETKLSDHDTGRERSSTNASCIRTRKDWAIEYTMYVSSRDGGTRPYRRLSAEEFHQMQWSLDIPHKGRMIGEKSIDWRDTTLYDEPGKEEKRKKDAAHLLRADWGSSKRKGHIRDFFNKLRVRDKPPLVIDKMGLLNDSSGFDATTSLRDILKSKSNLKINEWEIPNAAFARKFGLYGDGRPLPPSIRELPVAEDRALDVISTSDMPESIYPWRFLGPFTPQLWFDSGLDYRWKRKSV